jgi:sodium-independent sulfate anion transporter 11
LTFVLDLNNYRPFDLTGKFLSMNASSFDITACLFIPCTRFVSTGEIKSGIPVFQLPPFSFARPVESLIKHNESFNWTETAQEPKYITVTFDVILKDLGAGLALVPVIAILEQIAIAKAFSMNTWFAIYSYYVFYYHWNSCDTLLIAQAMGPKPIQHRK